MTEPVVERPVCDLVMKGGITSGVAYPAAVSALHERYDFHSIGGASAGAIAASATAVAQHGEAPGEDRVGGFQRLETVRRQLAEPGLLVGLFQTTKETRPLLAMLLAIQRRPGKWSRAFEVLRRLARRLALPAAVGSAAFLAVIAWLLGHAGVRWRDESGDVSLALVLLLGGLAFLSLVLTGLGLIALRLYTAVNSHLPSSFYGMCLGMSERPASGPALTEWLHERFQWIGGRRAEWDTPLPGERPLTFADLEPRVQLRVMTTDLTRGRPVRLPLAADHDYLFSPEELRALFPEDVVAHLEEAAGGEPVRPAAGDSPALWRFPDDELPVVVATRMSLSFPVLLAAVPLWTVDPEGGPVRHWFSDGGISSNFPIHFFDAWVPSRPTFGLNLAPAAPGADPEAPADAFVRCYPDSPPLPSRVPITSLGGLLSRIIDTMQNWRDTMQAELTGFHDRIAHIDLVSAEGGMNISMPDDVVRRVDAKGAAAGRRLLDTFDFDRHQERRYETFMGMLQEGLVPAAGATAPRGTVRASWGGGLSHRVMNGPPTGRPGRPAAWYPAAATATEALLGSAEQWLGGSLSFRPDSPLRPPASMRVTPDV